MNLSTVELLVCPSCQRDLSLREHEEDGGVIEQGVLACTGCGRSYPIEAGIPRFVRFHELTGLNRRFAQFYDANSALYRPLSTLLGACLGGQRRTRAKLLSRLGAAPGRVLEVSVGRGANLGYLFEHLGVERVVGLDISRGQLQCCRDLCRRRGYQVELVLGMGEALPFRDESFDCVLHVGGINFFSDKGRAVREMVRVAKPGAQVVIADESETGARLFEWIIPGFRRLFEGKREPVVPPVELLPAGMEGVRTDMLWRGLAWCIDFHKPSLPASRAARLNQ